MASQDWFEKDFYKILGVSKDVSDSDLKKDYRKLARENHPDANPGNPAAEAKFKDISEAYSVLSDSEQRKESDAVKAMGGGARFTAGGQQGGFEDVFGGLFGGGRGGFGGFDFGPRKGADLSTSVSINFIDSIQGTTTKLDVNGKPTTVKIPAGIEDGQKIKLAGSGQPSPNGGPGGDLLITVRVRKHPVFTRDGLNVRVEVPVTFVEAALGATIEVPTLGGPPVKLKVSPGTPSGRTLRVKGRGVQKPTPGDLLATIVVAVPSRLDEKAKKALLAFSETQPDESPRDDLITRAGAL
jgi:molecular chaperone DnaJ